MVTYCYGPRGCEEHAKRWKVFRTGECGSRRNRKSAQDVKDPANSGLWERHGFRHFEKKEKRTEFWKTEKESKYGHCEGSSGMDF